MKKTLVTLAVLAATGAASAQVTVYGRADIWFGNVTTETLVGGAVSSLSQTKLDSGGAAGSRIGFKGTEDLGGGLAANFQLEQGVALDNGAGGTTSAFFTGAAAVPAAFNRQAWVGLSGGFGSTRFGQTWGAYDEVQGASNGAFDTAFSPTAGVFNSTGYNSPPNTIMYISPDFGGLTANVSYSLGENKTAAVSAGSVTSLGLAYAAGPLGAQLGYQTEKPNGNSVAQDFMRLGGSYDLGVAKLMATYGKVDGLANVANSSTTEYQLGVDVPLGAFTVSGSYATSQDNATAGDGKRTGYGLAGLYTLSKRTALYGGYKSVTATAPATPDLKSTLLAVGIAHTF